MPRRPRIHLNNVPLHIVQRGHNREPCFFGEEDYQTYLHWLGEALKREGGVLHAYALMTNHVHLLLTPAKAEAVPRIIIALGRRYVQYINTSSRRTGTLWDSRYKSSLIQAETYLLTCQRYIELNPLRAGLVDEPAHYRWTSYRRNALGQPNAHLTPHAVYLALGRSDKERQTAYRALFRAQLDQEAIDDIRLALNQNQPLGNNRFYAKIEAMMGERREARPRGRPRLGKFAAGEAAAGQGELPV
ncbi:MAG: transposase [Betaproteobacteria bacterium]|nr:transposase [Betaproteobacteria bacterium]